jgi:hypothetical protein
MASSRRKMSLFEPCTSTPSKRKKYVCKYQHFWEKEFTWLKKSDTCSVKTWHTKLCNTNFSVAAGALYDVKRPAKRSTHVTAVEGSSKTKSITNFVNKKSSSVILSETLFSNFVAEHNLPFSLADHFTKSLPKLCK